MAARRSPVISIRLNAANQQFFAQMDPAIAKVVQFGGAANRSSSQMSQFGHQSVSSVQATSAALRVMEGSWTNNLRASERFIANVVGLGGILQKAFPLIGALAFAGLLVKLGQEAYKFFKEMEDRPRLVNNAFRAMSSSLDNQIDQIRLSTARLNLELAKLTGVRENTLAVELAEAVVEADKLADNIHKALVDMVKMAEDTAPTLSRRLLSFALVAPANDITDLVKKEQREVDQHITAPRQHLIRLARDRGDKADEEKQTKALNDEIVEYAKQQQTTFEQITKEAEKAGRATPLINLPVPKFISESGKIPLLAVQLRDTTDRTNMSRAAWEDWGKAAQVAQDSAAESAARLNVIRAKAARDEAEYLKILPERIAKLDAMRKASDEKASAAGQGKLAEIAAAGHGAALEAIESLNKRYEGLKPALGGKQLDTVPLLRFGKALITNAEQALAMSKAQEQWKTKLSETITQLRAQTAEQNILTAAIGRGYAATKAAAVAVQVMKDTAKEGVLVTPKQQAQLTGAADEAEEARRVRMAGEEVEKLTTQIEGERKLAAAQLQGASAAREAALAHRLDELAKDAVQSAVKGLTAAYRELDLVERANILNQGLFKVDERISDLKRLSAAILQGAEAERRAALESKYAQMLASGGDNGLNRELIRRTREADSQSHIQDVTKAALKPGTEVSDKLRDLDAQLQILKDIRATGQATVESEVALRKVRKEQLETLVQYQLQIGSATAGVKAFFIEMQVQGKLAGQVIYDAMKKATDGVADTLAKIMSGQIQKSKGDPHPYQKAFSELFRGIGGDLLKNSTTNAIHEGLGAIGKVFPSISGVTDKLNDKLTKKDGQSESSAFWVRLWSGASPLPSLRGAGLPTYPGTDVNGVPGSGIPRLGSPTFGSGTPSARTLATGGTPPFLAGTPRLPGYDAPAGPAGGGGGTSSTLGTFASIAARILLGPGGVTLPPRTPAEVSIPTGASGYPRLPGGLINRTGKSNEELGFPDSMSPASTTVGPNKPSGAAGDPLYVKPAGADPVSQMINRPILQGPGTASSVFSTLGSLVGSAAGAISAGAGGGGGTPSVTSTFTPRASGGPISAGSAYIAGEYGREVITGVSGYIHDAGRSRSMLAGGGGDNHYYSIDARGTDPALTAMHVKRAIEESHHEAVATSVRAVQDRGRRTVRSK